MQIPSTEKEIQTTFVPSWDISKELRSQFKKVPFSVLPYFTFLLRIHPAIWGALEDIRELFHIWKRTDNPRNKKTNKQTNKGSKNHRISFPLYTCSIYTPSPPSLVTGEFLSISLRVYVPVISQGMSVCCCQFIGSWRSKCTAPHLSRMKDFPGYCNIPQNVTSLWSYWLKNDELVTFLSRKRMEYEPFPIWGGGGGGESGRWNCCPVTIFFTIIFTFFQIADRECCKSKARTSIYCSRLFLFDSCDVLHRKKRDLDRRGCLIKEFWTLQILQSRSLPERS